MDDHIQQPDWIDLESVLPLKSRSSKKKGERDAATITGLSADTLKRRYPERIKHLSERRLGMKLRDALAIADGR